LKIAFVSHEGFPIKSGGVTLLNDLAREFQKNKLEIVTYLPKFKHSSNFESPTCKRLRVTRNSVGGITKFELLKFFVFGIVSLRQKIKKDEITHVYSIFAFPSGFLAYLATIRLSVKRIVIVDAIDLPGVENSPLRSSRFLRYLVRRTLKYASRILLIQGLENEFKSFCEYSYISVAAGISPPLRIISHKSTQKEFVILTIARLVKRKNISLAINILRDLINKGVPARLIIVGDGPEKSILENLAKELSVEKQIDFKGFINEDELPNLISSSDAYLFTGYNEGISVALLQALSFGIPAVVTQNLGNSAIFGELGRSFMLPSTHPLEFADLLNRLYQDRKFLTFAKETSLEIVRPFYWNNAISNYLPIQSSN
jgi:glycosyltransferase involved in cell wall biosynthesis